MSPKIAKFCIADAEALLEEGQTLLVQEKVLPQQSSHLIIEGEGLPVILSVVLNLQPGV